ncbi:hypothetical protein DHD32_01345 [Arenibacter sp. TNZ]|jgi:hypothetical protein|uniref:GNAT family N-acetyltransferase n=1 Tax=Arenibacter TaxID=178469 RepID=UPI000CD420BC|nr:MULTISPECIES: GNAT family N-acetyltransferase [Arenibacter]MCM4170107.1 hypothetical protein [Arenibacter sp. TNZ]
MQIKESRKISTVKRFWNIIKNGMFLFGLKNRLERIGIVITPYYWVKEEAEECTEPKIKGDVSEFIFRELSLDEMKLISKGIDNFNIENLMVNYENSQLCMGLEHNGEIAAYMFIGLKDLDYKGNLFRIKGNEAYLFNMWTFHSFRGRNLAPYLRYKCYQLLNDQGRDTKYSITQYFNKSSIKFKKKLNSKHLKFYLYINLFGKWQKHYLLKSYTY